MSKNLQIDNTAKEDRVTKTKTLYDATVGEIIWRNFLAGISRALGGLFFYFVFLLIIGSFLAKYLLPQIMPLINNFLQIGDSIEKLQQIKIPTSF